MAGRPFHRQVESGAHGQEVASGTGRGDGTVASFLVSRIGGVRDQQAGGRHLQARCVHGDLVIILHQDATKTWIQIEQAIAGLSDKCLEDGRRRTIYVVVGPEGGISDAEVASFTEAGAEVCVLGNNILRASTAGPVALSLLARALGRFA